MKRILAVTATALLAIGVVIGQQSSTTPNIGLKIPFYGTQDWQIPLSYDLQLLDQLLSGNHPLAGLTINGPFTVNGTSTFTGDTTVNGNFLPPSGSSLPASCKIGAIFFNTAAPAGFNLYTCTAANVWSVMPVTAADISPYIAAACATYKEATLPAGTFTANSTITPAAGCYIHGVGRGSIVGNGATTINFTSLNTKLFNVTNDNVHIARLTLRQIGTAVSGNAGIYIAGNGASGSANWANIEDINAFGFYNGVYIAGEGGSVDLSRVEVDASQQDGIVGLGAQGYWSNIIVQGNTGNGIRIGLCDVGPCGVGPFQSAIQTFGNGGWGEISTSQLFIAGSNSYFNNDFQGEISLTSVPPQADSGYIKDAFVQFAGQSVSFGNNALAPGILLGSGAISVVDNIHCFNNNGNCFTISGQRNLLSNIIALGSGQGGTNIYSIQGGAGNITVTNSHFGNPVIFAGGNDIFTGNTVIVESAFPAIEMLSGTNHTVNGNNITNTSGNSLQIDAGVTMNDGNNSLTGAFVNNGTRNATQRPPQGNFYNQSAAIPLIHSATTITPTTAIAFIDGTTNIQTINSPTGFTSPTFCAIPSGAWHTVTGGNIAIPSTANSNQVLCFYFSSSDGFWRPSY